MKTGHTENAGYCLIASAKRGPRRLLSVVLGTASENVRAQESQKLLNYGFQFYDSVRLYEKGQTVSTVQVWKGSESMLKAGLAADLCVSVPKGMADKLKADLVSLQPLLAPISAGQRVGTLRVTLESQAARRISGGGAGERGGRRRFRPRLGQHAAVVQVTTPRRMIGPHFRAMTVYLNGEFMPIEQAKIPVLDRGFIFGDGVYEVIPVYSRRPFRLRRASRAPAMRAWRRPHRQSLHRCAMGASWSRKIVAANPWDDQGVYLQVTRGVAPRDHAFPKGAQADRVHHGRSAGHAAAGAGANGRRRRSPCRISAGCAATSSRSRCSPTACCARSPSTGRRRSDPAARRLAHRGLGEQHLRGQERRRPHPAQVPPDAARHHLRRGARTRCARTACPRGAAGERSRAARGATRSGCTSSSQGSAADHDAGRQAGRPRGDGGQTGPGVRAACIRSTSNSRRRCMRAACMPTSMA